MQPYYRYPTQPQHPMQPFQVNQQMYGMNRMPGMNAMPRQPGSVERFLGPIGSGGVTGGTNVFTMLTNVQKVLKVAETMGPMIKQYGPAMRNLPSLMNAFKEFQNGGSSKKTEDSNEPETSKKDENIAENIAENNDKNQDEKEHTKLKKQEKEKKDTKDKKQKADIPETKSKKNSSKKSNKRGPTTKTIPSRPQSNMPKGYHLSGPKLYV